MVNIEHKSALVLLCSTMFVSLSLPLILEFINTYSAPTAVYALFIKRYNELVAVSHESKSYWGGAINVEVSFPLPAILLSTFIMVTGIPERLSLFIPIMGLARVIFFVLAKQILCLNGKKHVDVFSGIYYATVIVLYALGGNAIGRAEYGVVLLTFFIYSNILLLKSSINRQMSHRAGAFCFLTIFTLAAGFTYYTSITSILIITLFAPIVVRKLTAINLSTSHIPIISVLMIVYQPFYYSFFKQSNLTNFINNLLDFIKAQLKIEAQTEAYALHVGYVNLDLFSRIGGVWFASIIRLLSILVVVYIFLKYLPRKNMYDMRAQNVLWAYSLITILACLSELSYSFFAPTIPIRFISLFGLVLLLYLIKGMITYTESICHKPKRSLWKISALIMLGVIIVSNIGSFSSAWLYGAPKPLGYQKLQPLLTYCTYHCPDDALTLVADAYYSAIGFFHSLLFNRYGVLVYEPFGRNSITLFNSILTGDLTNITITLRNKGIKYLLHDFEPRPIWGDGWGYAVQLQNTELLKRQLSIIYDDGNLLLLGLL